MTSAAGVLCLLLLAACLAPAAALVPGYKCPAIPPHAPATNVNQLRADDIGLMMAIGDSITAAFAAHDTDILNGLVEYRTDSWSIGAGPESTTTFNFFKNFNSGVLGGSLLNTLPDDVYNMEHHIYPQVDLSSQLNAAVSMAKLNDVPIQIDYLVNMTETVFAAHAQDWKYITILIGANDICPSCDPTRESSFPDVWIANLNASIYRIYQTMPKTFVAVSYILNISGVWNVMVNAPPGPHKDYCMEMREKLLLSECGCLNDNATDRLAMDLHSVAFNQRIATLAEWWQAQQLPEFTVSAIPFFGGVVPWNLDFLSSLDCFHPSWEAHAAMGTQLWNSLWVPFAQKPINLPNATVLPMYCPGPNDFLQV